MPQFPADNLPVNLLASAARTTNTSTSVQSNIAHTGVILILDVTVASGTGGLIPQIRFHDPITAGTKIAWNIPMPVKATGTYIYMHYPGANYAQCGAAQYVVSAPLSQRWSVTVTVDDASSYTYSLSAYLMV